MQEQARESLHLQAALSALECRNDKENKADCQVTQLMQIQDQKVVDEHNLAMFKARQKELSAVTEIKRKSKLNQLKEESDLLSLLTKLQRAFATTKLDK